MVINNNAVVPGTIKTGNYCLHIINLLKPILMFTRTFSYEASLSKEALKSRLVGNHVTIHGLDFEVMEKNESLRIIPHAEQIDEIKTLPITFVEINETNGKTKVKIKSRMRKLDAGGPMLIMILCSLLLAASGVLLLLQEQLFSGLLLAASLLTYITFRLRLELSYFDYVRKVQSHVLNAAN